jgi:hypothetical protein
MSDDLLRLITPLRKALAWKGEMGFRDALPGVLTAIRSLERTIQVGETEGRKTEGPKSEQMGLGL